jgi:hypothetical protein
MPLTPEDMQKLIVQLETLCTEARTLQTRIKAAMVEAARRDLPIQRAVERRTKARKRR